MVSFFDFSGTKLGLRMIVGHVVKMVQVVKVLEEARGDHIFVYRVVDRRAH